MDKPRHKLNYEKPFCYMLVGPAACGKSAVRQKILGHPVMKDAVVVSTDDLTQEIAIRHRQDYGTTFERINSSAFKRYVKDTVRAAVAKRQSILVDRCNLTYKSRSVVTNLIPDDYNIVMVVMRWDATKVLHNLRTNPIYKAKPISIGNVINMFQVYQAPRPDEYDMLVQHEAIYG